MDGLASWFVGLEGITEADGSLHLGTKTGPARSCYKLTKVCTKWHPFERGARRGYTGWKFACIVKWKKQVWAMGPVQKSIPVLTVQQ